MSELCLIEIPWEARNLGMPAYQLEGDIENYKLVKSILEKKQAQLKENFFVQLKVDADKINEALLAQDAGFKLIEMSISPYINLNLVGSEVLSDDIKSIYSIQPEKIQAIENYSTSVKHLDSTIKNQITEISKETFTTDRFHMDPACKKSVADKRIGLWVEFDIFNDSKNYCTYLETSKGLIGFIIWNKHGFILGGLSKNFIGKGFGRTLYIQAIRDVMKEGFEEISTNISINNIPVLNLYSKLDFSFRDPKYILHYWFQI